MKLTADSVARFLAFRDGWNARNAGHNCLDNPHNKRLARVFWNAWERGYWTRDKKGLSVSIPPHSRRFEIGRKEVRPQSAHKDPGKRDASAETQSSGQCESQSGSESIGRGGSFVELQADRKPIRRNRQLSLFETDGSESPVTG